MNNSLTFNLGSGRAQYIWRLQSESLTSLTLFSYEHGQNEEPRSWLRPVKVGLQTLVIDMASIGDETSREIQRLLSGLSELILENCRISQKALLRLSARLAQQTCTCTKLVIRKCELDGDLLNLLLHGLKNNSTLEEVSLEGNNIDDPTNLASILPSMTSLRYLSLNHNILTNKGGQALLEALKKMPSLSKLKIQVQRAHRGKQMEAHIFRSIYFYSRWNEIEGWKLWRAKEGIWYWALPRLVKKKWPDVIFHLLRNHPTICDPQQEDQRPSKRIKIAANRT